MARFLLTILFLFASLHLVSAQENDTVWTQITSENDSVSFYLPQGFLVHKKEGDWVSIFGFQNEISFEIDIGEINSITKQFAKELLKRKIDGVEQIGDAVIVQTSSYKSNYFSGGFIIYTPKNVYSVHIKSEKLSLPQVVAFILGFKIGSQQIPMALKPFNEKTSTEKFVWQNLKSSSEVIEALAKKPDKKTFQIDYKNFSTIFKSSPDDVFEYKGLSRPPFILNIGLARLTPQKVAQNSESTLRLETSLTASGQVGNTKVIFAPNESLAKTFAEVFRDETKFVPAQKNGVNVDFPFSLTYQTSLSVYDIRTANPSLPRERVPRSFD